METIPGSPSAFRSPSEEPAPNAPASVESYVTTGEAAPFPAPDKPIRSRGPAIIIFVRYCVNALPVIYDTQR